jgi:hypothetical protein
MEREAPGTVRHKPLSRRIDLAEEARRAVRRAS